MDQTLTPKPNRTHKSALFSREKAEITCPQSAVPASSAQRHSIHADTKAADTVFMSGKNTYTLALQGVPDIASPIIVSTKQNATRDRECDRRYSTQNIIMCESVELAISANIEKTARSIIRTRCEGITVGEKSVKNAQNITSIGKRRAHTEQR